MREALARTDHDFVVAEPRRRKAAARGPFTVLATLLRLTVRLAAYPNRVLGGLVFAIVVAILVNALLLQHSRHPAPLFHSTMTVPVPQEQPAPQAARTPAPADAAPVAPVQESAAPAADVPAPPAKPSHDAIGQLLKSENAPAAAKAAPHHHPHEAEAKPQSADGIGQLLKSEAAPEDKPKTVLAVQQALVKLGFVVRPDGQMGSVTRHALEQYERDHGLPVEPQLSPKLLHRLSAASGIKID